MTRSGIINDDDSRSLPLRRPPVAAGAAVGPDVLGPTGMPATVIDFVDLDEDRTLSDSAIGREDRTPPNLGLSCAVRPSVLSPTGTPATEGSEFQSVNSSPGDMRPTRIMAECKNTVAHSAASSPTTPVAQPEVENGNVFVSLPVKPTSSSTCSRPIRIPTGSSSTSGDRTSVAYQEIWPDLKVGAPNI